MNNTQLTSAKGYNTENMVFSKVITSTVPVVAKRINILTKNPDGTIGDLVLATENVFSYGVSANTDPTTKKITGYNLPLCLWSRDGPSEKERIWTDTFNRIVEKCKEHIVECRSQIGQYDLEMSDLKRFNPLYWKKDANGVLPNTGPSLYCKLIVSKKNGMEQILSPFFDADTGEEIDPMLLQGKYCFANVAAKIESIYIGNKISLQVKVYEAEVSLCDKGMKSLLPRKREEQTQEHEEEHEPEQEQEEREEEAGENVSVPSSTAPIKEEVLPKKTVISRKKK